MYIYNLFYILTAVQVAGEEMKSATGLSDEHKGRVMEYINRCLIVTLYEDTYIVVGHI